MPSVDAALLEALSADSPCGEDLEDTQLLASFDGYRLFGQTAPLAAETDWRDIRDRSLEALHKSKDFRLLTHLASAVVRTDGFAGLVQTLAVAARWLQSWDEAVFPRIDEDSILRRNALNGFADRMAVVDGVRRAPILSHPQLGSVSIRDIEIALGQLTPAEGETAAMDQSQLKALLTATAATELQSLADQLDQAIESLKSIEAAMRSRGGSEAAPDFESLASPLKRTWSLVSEQLSARAPASPAAATGPGAEAVISVGLAGDAIRNRQDATRALDAVAEFFRTHEPSSPIPLLLERAKRLVAKNFLEVLEELAPDALSSAKAASGVRDPE